MRTRIRPCEYIFEEAIRCKCFGIVNGHGQSELKAFLDMEKKSSDHIEKVLSKGHYHEMVQALVGIINISFPSYVSARDGIFNFYGAPLIQYKNLKTPCG